MGAVAHAEDSPRPEGSAWAPLRVRVFRVLWLASLVSLTGNWFQTVGGQWLLVDEPHASISSTSS